MPSSAVVVFSWPGGVAKIAKKVLIADTVAPFVNLMVRWRATPRRMSIR